jgi:hypothetical protein
MSEVSLTSRTGVPLLGGLTLFRGSLFRRSQLLCSHFAAKRRDLDRFRPESNMCQAEATADDPAVLEETLDLIRMRRRADVEVLGSPTEQQISHTAAHQIRDVAVLVEPIENLERVRIDLGSGERVCGSLDDDRVTHCLQIVGECATIRLCVPPLSSSLRWS